jgi:trk system potassium uptake protein TrkH
VDVGRCINPHHGRLAFHTKLVLIVTSALILIGFIFYYIFEMNETMVGMPAILRFPLSFFQSVTPRTAGFTAINLADAHPLTIFITTILMFIGGSSASIAGGVKTTTFIIVLLYALRGNHNGRGINIGNRNINTALIDKSFSIVGKSLMLVVLSVCCLLITEMGSLKTGVMSIFELVFETISAFATVGLSLGITGSLTPVGKVVLICVMFIGRTGIVAMTMTIIANTREKYAEYPSASVMVG